MYAGILTCGVAYTLQIFGQKFTSPTIASIILCMESVFAVVGGSLILHETMTPREVWGCIFMIIAVVLSQIQMKNFKKGLTVCSQNNEE
ncbi:putative membrane protein [Clostridium sp. CAG:813]|nr:putative membrane protein [Clostridium sp. CAG:813]